MKSLGASLLAVPVVFLFVFPAIAEDAQNRIAQTIRTSLEESGCLPTDDSIYAARVTVSHNWDVPKEMEKMVFVKAFSKDMPLLTEIMGKPKVTRSFSSGNEIVLTVKYGEKQIAGEPPLQMALFFTVVDNKIAAEQVYADRTQLKPLMDAMRAPIHE